MMIELQKEALWSNNESKLSFVSIKTQTKTFPNSLHCQIDFGISLKMNHACFVSIKSLDFVKKFGLCSHWNLGHKTFCSSVLWDFKFFRLKVTQSHYQKWL